MTQFNYFSAQMSEINNHATEATLGILSFKNPTLRQALGKLLHTPAFAQENTGLLGNPVFDALFAWQSQEKTTDELIDLLHAKTIATIASDLPNPYLHQYQAWQKLSTHKNQTPNSLIITSGTGSGKTECFMVPILDDLIRQYDRHGQPLVGVQALFLYPLNALINSQQERLDKWTAPFGEGIRFCLYNGNTPESPNQSHTSQNQIHDRTTLRDTPPPILVTNATMLEYMLIRQKDAPILQQSQGTLKWIVLDETHTYVGSVASELSLLLRRVMLAFGVEAKNVRFVATSATIGDDENAKAKLTQFLSALTGTTSEQIHIVSASREIPELIARFDGSPAPLDEIIQTDLGEAVSPKRFALLNAHPFAHQLRDTFTKAEDGSAKIRQRDLAELTSLLSPKLTERPTNVNEHLLKWLDICSFTKPDKDSSAFLPLRGHLFLKTLIGLYACVNPECTGKGDLAHKTGGVPDWQFGRLYTHQKECCDSCDYPVFELIFCDECQTPHLLTTKSMQSIGTHLNQKLIAFSKSSQDEFVLNALDSENEDNENDNETTQAPITYDDKPTILMPTFASRQLASTDTDTPVYEALYLNQQGELFATAQDGRIAITIKDSPEPLHSCDFCASHSTYQQLRPINLGSPFYMGEIAPRLLEYCQTFDDPDGKPLPHQGKRLISFTDSRQGTARITMKLNHDAVQRTLWHIIYDTIAQGASSLSSDEQSNILKQIDELSQIIPALQGANLSELANEKQQELLNLQQKLANTAPTAKPILWRDMVTEITKHSQFTHIKHNLSKISSVYHLNDDLSLANLLLLREFAYRSKKFNTLETLGLVYLDYPTLCEQTLPKDIAQDWQSLGLNEKDWQDYLKLVLDFFVRNAKALHISKEEKDQLKAISSQHFGDFGLIAPTYEGELPNNTKKWLKINAISPERSQRLIKLLALPKGLTLSDPYTQDRIHKVLSEVWRTLVRCDFFAKHEVGTISTYRLSLDKVHLTLAKEVFVCPTTHRLLDTTLQGYTPYLPPNLSLSDIIAKKDTYRCQSATALPLYEPDPLDPHEQSSKKAWLKNNDIINKLRDDSLWTDISDTVVAGSSVLVASEHSAQIEQSTLQKYEKDFKAGKINILNCSTTMEMGVDIGGISAVAMNNVPPHPANYLQRTGRAGRRGESQAIAFTLCKDNPHEQMVFHNTKWAFDTKPIAPYVVLSSKKILQRHINAFLLAEFLQKHNQGTSNITQKVGQFFFGWHSEKNNHYSTEHIKNHLKPLLETLPNEPKFTQTPFIIMQDWLTQLQLQGIDSSNNARLHKGILHLIKDSDFCAMPVLDFVKDCQEALCALTAHTTDKLYTKLSEYQDSQKHTTYQNKLIFDITSLANGFLLSELARFGFLPRYGFPSGLVELDIYNSQAYLEQKTQKTTKEREDNLSFASGKPIRDLAIALREYAPGNEVAIDGLVFLSAGLSLNQRHAEGGNQAQLIHQFAQCTSCGAMSDDAQADEPCQSCGKIHELADLTTFIEPMGFKVDYHAKPHARADSKSYVPVQDPKIQANTPLIPLPNPQLGSYRCDDNGLIFHHSRGTKGFGYLVCLHCGRAESVLHDKHSYEFDKQKTKFINEHIPMKPIAEIKKSLKKADGYDWRDAKGLCVKHGSPIHHLHIGATDTTNVFEFYSINPKTGEYFDDNEAFKSLLLTLAVTLRDTLASLHGINHEELGFGVKPVRLDNKTTQCVFVYDKAQGGAGFSSNAKHHLHALFQNAPSHLACPDDCGSACHSCLLGYDTRFVATHLNRHVALEYFGNIKALFDLPESAKALLANAQFCPLPIGERLASELIGKDFDTLRVFLNGQPQDWNLSTALHDKLMRWTSQPINIELILSPNTITTMNAIDLDRLDGWMKAFDNVHLYSVDGHLTPPLVQLIGKHKTLTIASTDTSCGIPNDDFWHMANGHYMVESTSEPAYTTRAQTLPQNTNNSHTIKINDELNGTLADIGERFWQLIAQQASSLSAQLTQKQGIKSITYSDPYVCTPLTVFLLVQTLNHLKQHYGDDWNADVLVKTSPSTNEQNPTRIHHSWKAQEKQERQGSQEKVINQCLKACGFNQETKVYPKGKLPHYRYFQIIWGNNQTTEIYLDWGFGFLEIDSGDYYKTLFDFGGTIEQQVKMLICFKKSTLPLVSKKATMITILST